MKREVAAFLRKSRYPLLIALGTAPVPVVVLGLIAPQLLPYAWVFPVTYIVLALLAMLPLGRWRLPLGMGATVVQVLLWVCLAPQSGRTAAGVVAVFYGGVLLWSLRIAGWSERQEPDMFWGFFGMIAHLVGQLVGRSTQATEQAALGTACNWLLAVFFLFAFLQLLSMNRGSLVDAGGGRQAATATMRRENVLLTLALFGAAALICLIPAVARGIQALLALPGKLLDLVSGLFSSAGGGSGTQTMEEAGDAAQAVIPGDASTSTIMVILERIAQVLCLAGLVALLIFALRWLWKKVPALLRRLLGSLGRYGDAVAEDYTDEITDTRESEEQRQWIPTRFRRQSQARRNLSPRQQIRWAYRRQAACHPEWTADATARENLPVDQAALYELARYSDHPVTQADAERFLRKPHGPQ